MRAAALEEERIREAEREAEEQAMARFISEREEAEERQRKLLLEQRELEREQQEERSVTNILEIHALM